ncbi:Sulfite reductase (NADPH) flavoprotein alpha-component [Methylophaga frappieri]|uniref:Sulfite reductase [NADPH] flavoprotein alpha-component n=1 Tax=Methylophaga frappieri (strain ATCC BAA-2434 / DSM 25690 / JAM7) TaxID=754477 RepID=I1YF56_METFJ|nr:assimilatory sulfite reductase (NADPH) flavoprotein subunit [Methylophaga frappieri]AFJ01549.1 Sulfite reductase (NADPH) flavoprotein alpha-component [Methylophaga frappieri]
MNFQVPNAPLTDQQLQQLNALLGGLEGWQVDWLAGYLAGWRAAQNGTAAAITPALPSQTAVKLTIMFGSQTGNAEGLAERLLEKAKTQGIDATLVDMGAYKLRQLKSETHLALITSTHGEGDPPDNAMDLYEFLNGKKAPKLNDLKYSVLSLGDSSYEYFCQTGIDFDKRLSELGAKAIIDRVDCDVDYDDLADKWIEDFLNSIETTAPAAAASAPATLASAGTTSAYDRKNPFMAPMLTNQLLNGKGSNKETRHIEISLEESGLQYKPGDALGVYAQNDPALVAALITALKLDAEQVIRVDDDNVSVDEALTRHREITVLTKPLLEKWAELSGNATLQKLLEDKTETNNWIAGRDVLDLVQAYPIAELDAETFISVLRKMPPRLYSIASSQAAVEDEVHLTIAVVRYNAHGRDRGGVASTWFADRLDEDATVPVYIDGNKNFKLPDNDDVPVIMIGPGTGVAPFRSFMQEREAREATGRNWLFFGDQHFLTDFLYQTEWQDWHQSGLLTKIDVAFSRDGDQKVYVQHKLRDKSEEVWRWLEEGAHIYVCGDATYMAPDVNEALLDIICQHGDQNREQATEYLRQMTRDKRYQRDVY